MPRLSEKERLAQFRKQVEKYPQWDSRRKQQMLASAFDSVANDNESYMRSVSDAASQKKPVLMLIGRSSDAATRYLVENTISQVRAQNKDAYYMFVDMDTVDRNSAMGKYAFENLAARGQEPPFTMLFSLSQGADGKARADAPGYYRMGSLESKEINEAISRTRLQMHGRFSDYKRPAADPAPKPAEVPAKAGSDSSGSGALEQAIALSLMQAQRQNDPKNAFDHYKRAVDLADAAKNPSLQAASRIELGLACLSWGFAEQGLKWILDGSAKNPDLFNTQKNQPFIERLKQGGLNQSIIDQVILRGKQDPLWFQKDKEAFNLLKNSLIQKKTERVANPFD